MNELAEPLISENSLFGTLFANWVVPLPLIGVAAILVMASEFYCLKKEGRYESAYATVLLLLCTGMGSLYAVFVTGSTVFSSSEHMDGIEGVMYPGDRIPIEPWYYPTVVALALGIVVVFTWGVVWDLKKGNRLIVLFRLPVFLLASYLSVSVASTPIQMNSWLEMMEEEYKQEPVATVESTSPARKPENPLEPRSPQSGMPVFHDSLK